MVSVIGIVVSAVVSFCVARFVRPWSKVVVLLKPQMEDGTKKGKGREACFILSISNGCFSRGVTSYNVCPDLMPALLFRGFRVRSVMTMNNDLAKFYIPVVPVSADSSKLILNIKWIRSNTEAKFLIKGVLDAGMSIKEVVVDFFPGLFHGVKIHSSGNINKEHNKDNFGAVPREIPYNVYEKI